MTFVCAKRGTSMRNASKALRLCAGVQSAPGLPGVAVLSKRLSYVGYVTSTFAHSNAESDKAHHITNDRLLFIVLIG